MKKGKPVTGWKMVPKRATRSWVKEEDAKAALLQHLKESEVIETKLVSPAAAEKLLKAQKLKLPDGLTVAISSGNTIAPESDPRPAVAMHLAATTSDIVLMLGYDLSKLHLPEDRLEANRLQHHRNMIKQALIMYETVQWVIVDHTADIDSSLQDLPNLVTDSLASVLALI